MKGRGKAFWWPFLSKINTISSTLSQFEARYYFDGPWGLLFGAKLWVGVQTIAQVRVCVVPVFIGYVATGNKKIKCDPESISWTVDVLREKLVHILKRLPWVSAGFLTLPHFWVHGLCTPESFSNQAVWEHACLRPRLAELADFLGLLAYTEGIK